MKKLKEKIIKIFYRKEIIILMLIMLAGIFLRAYNFSEWARFNDDQVRDALVVDRMVSGESFPLLGPKAGGTTFNLGPAFYYFEYFSVSIFGNSPEALAYPILFFSILSVPLFYILFRKVFGSNIGLMLVSIYTFSFFSIKYSRFSWNMNLIPFFLLAFIYFLFKAFDENEKNKRKFISIFFLGLVIGIGVQIHTLLAVFFMTTFFIFMAVKFFKEKKIYLRKIFFVFFLAFILNVPLLVYDFNSNGENLKAFLGGANSKTDSKISFGEKVLKSFSCQINGNSFVLSAYGENGECNIFQKNKEANKWAREINIFFSTAFFIFGLGLLFYLTKNKYFWENNIFKIMFFYFISSLVLFVPLAGEISLRMFVAIIFAPFLILGLFFHLMIKKMGNLGMVFSIIVTLLFLATNLFVFKGTYFSLGDMYRDDKYFGGGSLGELRNMAEYIEDNAKGNKKIALSKFSNAKSLEYLIEKSGLEVEIKSDEEVTDEESYFFYVKSNDFRTNKKKEKIMLSDFENFEEIDSKIVGQYTIFKLKIKN